MDVEATLSRRLVAGGQLDRKGEKEEEVEAPPDPVATGYPHAGTTGGGPSRA
jgi:hypothetical protein